MLDFSRLIAPRNHGDILMEPEISRWPSLIEINRKRLSSVSYDLCGIPIQELQRQTRSRLARSATGPILVLGHQPEFLHAGVWSKYIAASRTAARLGGTAINLVADSDVPRHHELRFPSSVDGRLRVVGVRHHGGREDIAYECLPAMSQPEIDDFSRRLELALGPRFQNSVLGPYLHGLRGTPSARDWVSQQVSARQSLESLLSVPLTDHRVSEVWGGPLLAHIIHDAHRFTAAYNQALGKYRRRAGIRGRRHPMPDLDLPPRRVELPLWAYDASGIRQRVFVAHAADAVEVFAGQQRIAIWSSHSLKRWETAEAEMTACSGFRLRPRALLLTLWARLFLADLFIHGIGGAKYDQITDMLIEDYFGCPAPEMACVSATLLLDDPADPPEPERRARVKRMLRDVRYNGERYLAENAQISEWVAARRRAVEDCAALRGRSGAREIRKKLFLETQAVNQRLAQAADALRGGWLAELEALDRAAEHWSLARDREYFVGLFSERTLREFVARFP